jgi:cation transport ATPase
MAQTKRKRRTKHRGNAAGGIEARGRTGRKPTAEEQKKAARQTARDRRAAKPPSWNSAAMKAMAMAAVLFALTQFHILGKNTTVSQGLVLAVFAMVVYTPLAYFTDRAVYNRVQRRQQQPKP